MSLPGLPHLRWPESCACCSYTVGGLSVAMTKSPSPNSRQPWTNEETVALQRLARACTPRSEIARQLGRSPDAVANYASKIGVKLVHPGVALPARRKALPPPIASDDRPKPPRVGDLRSSDEGKPPNRLRPLALGAGAAEPEHRLRVMRLDRPTLPWIWEIRRDGAATPFARSQTGYRSAEDAWDAGTVVLAGTRRQGEPER